MSGGRVLRSYNLVIDLSADYDNFSDPINIDFLDNAGIILSWTGTAPVGVFEVYASNEAANPSAGRPPTRYTLLEFASPIAITGASGDHSFDLNQVPYSWIAIKYIRTSGTGSMQADITIKKEGS